MSLVIAVEIDYVGAERIGDLYRERLTGRLRGELGGTNWESWFRVSENRTPREVGRYTEGVMPAMSNVLVSGRPQLPRARSPCKCSFENLML